MMQNDAVGLRICLRRSMSRLSRAPWAHASMGGGRVNTRPATAIGRGWNILHVIESLRRAIPGGHRQFYNCVVACRRDVDGPIRRSRATAGAWRESRMAQAPGGPLRTLPPGGQQWQPSRAGLKMPGQYLPEQILTRIFPGQGA